MYVKFVGPMSLRDIAALAMAAAASGRRERFRRADDWKEHFTMCDERDVRIDGARVAEALRDAAISGIRTFLEGLEDGLRKAQEEAKAESAPRQKPKPAKARVKVKATARPRPAAKPKPAKARASRSRPGAA